MSAPDGFHGRRIIECLRSGISSLELGLEMTLGREKIARKVDEDLKQLKADGETRYLIVEGGYGQGKTHVLNMVHGQAFDQNFAVARIIAGRDTPLGRVNTLYERVARNLTFKDSPNDRGLEVFFQRINPKDPRYVEWMDWIDKRQFRRLYNVLEAYFTKGTESPSLVFQELEGTPVPLNALKRVLNLYPKTPRLKLDDYWGHLMALSKAVRAFGHSGLVLLIDEAELIQGLSVLQRIRAYEIIGRLSGLGAEETTPPGLYVVFSFASSFYEFLQAREEEIKVKEKLTHRQEPDRKKFVAEALTTLREKRVSLTGLTPGDKHSLGERMIELYSQAYENKPKVDINAVRKLTSGQPLRTFIRTLVQCADLRSQYPKSDPLKDIQVIGVDEGEIEQGTDEDTPAEKDDGV